MAESFGSDPERYDRSRPRYPETMVKRIVAASPGPDFLDVGIGTGIVARQLQAAGARVLGVDVDARMAEFARRRGFEVEVGRFEDWDPAGRRFDAVVSGQAWHWVEPVAGAMMAADVLRPGGRLALFRNDGRPPPDLTEAFASIYRRLVPDSLTARAGTQAAPGARSLLTTAVDAIRRTDAFDEPEQWRFEWERSYRRDDWLDQVPTTGEASRFSPARLEELLAALGAAIDAAGGRFLMRYVTVVVTARRTSAVEPQGDSLEAAAE